MSKKEKLIEFLQFTQEFLDDDFSEYISWIQNAIFDDENNTEKI